MKEVYLIRHGETAENRAGVLIGQSDPPLADESRVKIRSTVAPFRPDAVYSSPLRRARETAALLFPGNDVIIDADLVERGFGEFEGRPVASLSKEVDGVTTYAFRDEDVLVRSGGEPLNSLESRIRRFIERMSGLDAGKIAVVSHGTLISHMVRILLGEEKRRPSPRNTHAVYFKLDNYGKVTGLKYDVEIQEA